MNIEKVLITIFLKVNLRMAASEGSFYVKKINCHFFHIKIQTECFLQSCFPLADVAINFLVSLNYGFQNSICSSKESIISRGSFAIQIL